MYTGWRLRKKYKPENDKARKGGIIEYERAGTTEPRINTTPINSIGSEQSERRQLLPTATVSDVGTNSSSPGKNSSNVRRRFFGKRRK